MDAVNLPEKYQFMKKTIGFQERSAIKMSIKHKNIGDGFQADFLCYKGLIYSFYFRHQYAPSKYTKERIFQLHSKILCVCLFN